MMTEAMTYLLILIVAGFTQIKAQMDPTNIVCTAINSTALQLTWDQATDPSILGYYLYIERVDGLRIEPNIPSVSLSDKTFDNYDFAGLGEYGTYNITIHSYTSSDNLTNYVTTCTTAEDVPNGSPSSFDCTGISTSALRCSWDTLAQVYWNGVPLGYAIEWLSLNVSALYQTTVDPNVTTTEIRSLSYGTTYVVRINPYTSVGQGTLYTTATAATQVLSVEVVENVTRYYCNEAVPGVIVFAWEEMPCTIYSGTIAGLMTTCLLFIAIISCLSCCGKTSANNLSLSFFEASNGRRRKRRDEYGDDDDDDVATDIDDEDEKNTFNEDQLEDLDEDGFENEGYRSDEDPDSPDGRESKYPDDIKSPIDNTVKPTSRKLGKMDKKDANLDKEGSTFDGRVTARDIELETIDEDRDISEEDTLDSDYDSQYDSESTDDGDDDISNVSKKGGLKAVEVKTAATNKSTKKDALSTVLKGRKNITTNKKASSKGDLADKNKSGGKSPATTIALIHATEADNNVASMTKNSSEFEYRGSVHNNDQIQDSEFDNCGSTIKNHSPSVIISSSKNGHNTRASFEDDWGETGDKDDHSDIRKQRILKENFKLDPLNRNSGHKNETSHRIVRKDSKDKTKAKTTSKDSITENIKDDQFEQRKELKDYDASHDIEINTWEAPCFQSERKIAASSSREDYKTLSAKADGHITSPYQSNDWDDNDGWGGVFLLLRIQTVW